MKLAWSELSKIELAEIRRYSIARWGRHVAAAYLADLATGAKDAAADPGSLRVVRGAFRIRRTGSHYLLFHLEPEFDRLTVVRVLHIRMDIERHLPAEVRARDHPNLSYVSVPFSGRRPGFRNAS